MAIAAYSCDHQPEAGYTGSVPGTHSILLTAYDFGGRGGGSIIPTYLALSLRDRGYKVAVFHASNAPAAGGPYALTQTWTDGIRVFGVHNRTSPILDLDEPELDIDNAQVTSAFCSVLDDFAPTLIHMHNLHNLGLGIVKHAKKVGIPSLFTPHNMWALCPRAHLETAAKAMCSGPSANGASCGPCTGHVRRDIHELRKQMVQKSLSNELERVLAISKPFARAMMQAGAPPARVFVVPNASPASAKVWKSTGLHRKLGRMTADELTIGLIGSGRTHKGAHLLIKASTNIDSLRLCLIGDYSEARIEQLRAIDPTASISFEPGYSLTEVSSIMERLDILCVASTVFEGNPLVIQEAHAARVPVIAAAMGGVTDSIRHGVNGLLFQGRSVEDLRSTLLRVRDEAGLLERLQAGITEPRTWDGYVDETVSHYSEVRRRVTRHAPPVPITVLWTSSGTFDRSTVEKSVLRPIWTSDVIDPSEVIALPADLRVVERGCQEQLKSDAGLTGFADMTEVAPDARCYRQATQADVVFTATSEQRAAYLKVGIRNTKIAVLEDSTAVLRTISSARQSGTKDRR